MIYLSYNRLFSILLITSFFLFTHCEEQKRNNRPDIVTSKDSLSYSYGVEVAAQMIRISPDAIDKDLFVAGFLEKHANNTRIDEATQRKLIRDFFTKESQKSNDVDPQEAKTNLEEGERFLAENREKDDVKVTQSGLQYKIIKQGNGSQPKLTDKVKVHYAGWFVGGEEFDSSYKRNQPAEFPVTGVIRGWTEILQLMPTGSIYEVYIPYNLAYGASGRSGIGPNRMLIFKIELLDIVQS